MSRLVVLSLGQGNLYHGFPVVTAQIGETNNPHQMKFTASLPAAPEIPELYHNWQLLYSAFYQRVYLRLGVEQIDDTFEIEEAEITNVSEAEIADLCLRLSQRINVWLNSTEFRKADQQLRTQLKPSEEIRFTVETNDNLLRRLPWHLWNFFEDYPCAEVALSASEYQQTLKFPPKNQEDKIKILAIFGNSKGIDITQDQVFLQNLLNQAEIEFFLEPKLETLNDRLWQQHWDILFFAGHSSSQEKGCFQLNQTDTVTLNELKYGLRQAISRGLKLAIFNSCDSLGLAQQLQDLQIPQVIVMREPVPDMVAQAFLKHFLAEFSSGRSLYTAMRAARERLQGIEREYPCATWLPVICQNPAEPPMIWQQQQPLTEDVPKVDSLVVATRVNNRSVPRKVRGSTGGSLTKHRSSNTSNHRLQTLLVASVLVAALVMGVRHFGMLQPWELQSYDHLMELRPPDEKPDPRLLIVTIDEADIQYQIQKKMNMRWSLSDQALAELLQKLEQYQPRSIGIDVYRDFSVDPHYPDLITRLKQDLRLFTVCKVSAPNDGAPDGNPPPPEVPKERLGFTDFVPDVDGIPRRQLLQMTPPLNSSCTAKYALNFQLAQHYLNAQGIKWDITPQENLQIGNVVFKQLKSHTSGYQKVDASGYQVLLNYRSVRSLQNIAQQVALKDILNDHIKPDVVDSVKNRIVLIGVTAPTSSDRWQTPYTTSAVDSEQQISGVFLQAQMVSNILSAVLDGRPLLWWWSGWVEALWIWAWSLLGGIIAWRIQQPLYLGLAIFTATLTLFGICFGIFTQAGWIPLVPAALTLLCCAVVLKILPDLHASKSSRH
ncbi:MAG: CHASE2 domain-containing protein [Stigonema ocellatum SAG 48.90 = DSM 106950]|nr:CHASE2 domain-containing protein [Stigonema ocellatum SAG 48.90 = DSM 106950]